MPVGRYFRLLSKNRGVDVDEFQPPFKHHIIGGRKEFHAVDILVGRIRVGKMEADISQAGRAQEGIADCMEQNIRVRMTEKPLFKGDGDAADDELPFGHQLMDIMSYTIRICFLRISFNSLNLTCIPQTLGRV